MGFSKFFHHILGRHPTDSNTNTSDLEYPVYNESESVGESLFSFCSSDEDTTATSNNWSSSEVGELHEDEAIHFSDFRVPSESGSDEDEHKYFDKATGFSKKKAIYSMLLPLACMTVGFGAARLKYIDNNIFNDKTLSTVAKKISNTINLHDDPVPLILNPMLSGGPSSISKSASVVPIDGVNYVGMLDLPILKHGECVEIPILKDDMYSGSMPFCLVNDSGRMIVEFGSGTIMGGSLSRIEELDLVKFINTYNDTTTYSVSHIMSHSYSGSNIDISVFEQDKYMSYDMILVVHTSRGVVRLICCDKSI